LLVLLLTAAVATVTAVLVLGGGSPTAGPTSSDPVTSSEDRANVAAATRVLEALPRDPESAVVPEILAELPPGGEIMPAEAIVEVIPDTWERSGDRAEVGVTVTLPNGSVDRFGVVMLMIDGEWRVAMTVRAP